MAKESREPYERFKLPSWWINANFVWNHRRQIGENHNAFLSRMKREMAPTTKDLERLQALVRRVLDGGSFNGSVEKEGPNGGFLF